MTIHQDIVRIQIEHNCDPVEAFRLAWMKNIPRHLRRNGTQASKLNVQHQQEAGSKRSATATAEAAARRTALLAQIAGYLDQGIKSTDIAQKIGISRRTVNRMALEIRPKEERLMPADTPEQNEALMLHFRDLRNQGLSWVAISASTGWSRDYARRKFNAWEAQQ